MENFSDSSKIILFIAQLVTVGSAIIVAFHPNILHASVFLLMTFLGAAIMFLYAGADFIAGAQVIIYVGGVTILVLFAIMLTQWLYHIKLRDVRTKILIPVILLAIGLVPFLFRILKQVSDVVVSSKPENFEAFAASPKTAMMGEALLGNYLLPFEGITVLLLGALVGAVWLARPAK